MGSSLCSKRLTVWMTILSRSRKALIVFAFPDIPYGAPISLMAPDMTPIRSPMAHTHRNT